MYTNLLFKIFVICFICFVVAKHYLNFLKAKNSCFLALIRNPRCYWRFLGSKTYQGQLILHMKMKVFLQPYAVLRKSNKLTALIRGYPGAANQMYLINLSLLSVRTSIKAKVLSVCWSGALRRVLTQYHNPSRSARYSH